MKDVGLFCIEGHTTKILFWIESASPKDQENPFPGIYCLAEIEKI